MVNPTGSEARGSETLSSKTKKILSDAERRDEQATLRDVVSDERAAMADREAFLDSDAKYPGQAERRAAALDRARSRSDRESSAVDRARLTEVEEGDSSS